MCLLSDAQANRAVATRLAGVAVAGARRDRHRGPGRRAADERRRLHDDDQPWRLGARFGNEAASAWASP